MFSGFSDRVNKGYFSPVPGNHKNVKVGIRLADMTFTTEDNGTNWDLNKTLKVGRLKTDSLTVGELDFGRLPELAKTSDLGKVVVSDGKQGLKFDYPPPSSSSEVVQCSEKAVRLEKSLGDRSYIATGECRAIVLPDGVHGCIISIKCLTDSVIIASNETITGRNWETGSLFSGSRLKLEKNDYVKIIYEKNEWLLVNYF